MSKSTRLANPDAPKFCAKEEGHPALDAGSRVTGILLPFNTKAGAGLTMLLKTKRKACFERYAVTLDYWRQSGLAALVSGSAVGMA